MAFVRLSPSDYCAVAHAHERLALACHDFPSLRSCLALTLAAHSPELAERVRRLSDGQVKALHDHLRAARGKPACQAFGPDEWRAVALASRFLPLTARLTHPAQQMLVRHFRDSSPDLARKVGRLSAEQFRGLLDQARRLLREGA